MALPHHLPALLHKMVACQGPLGLSLSDSGVPRRPMLVGLLISSSLRHPNHRLLGELLLLLSKRSTTHEGRSLRRDADLPPTHFHLPKAPGDCCSGRQSL
jgi:hypothetical protein